MLRDSIDCTPALQLVNNPEQVSLVEIRSTTQQLKPTIQLNPNQYGMLFVSSEEYIIDIYLVKTMAVDSIAFHPLTNIDSFKIQLHNANGYYLEIRSVIGQKAITGLTNQQANLIRIIILGTDDGYPPKSVALTIVITYS